MTPEHLDFYNKTVVLFEKDLVAHDLGELFTGKLFNEEDEDVSELRLPDMGKNGLILTAEDLGRLFMVPDFSTVSFSTLTEREDGTPAGVHVFSKNNFVQDEEQVDIVAYRDEQGVGLRIDALYLARMMLKEEAPDRLCSIAFGLQVCTAYRLGFSEVTLFAAGYEIIHRPMA